MQNLQYAIEPLEQQMILDAMERAGFNRVHAAKLPGLSERTLRYKLKKHPLE